MVGLYKPEKSVLVHGSARRSFTASPAVGRFRVQAPTGFRVPVEGSIQGFL